MTMDAQPQNETTGAAAAPATKPNGQASTAPRALPEGVTGATLTTVDVSAEITGAVDETGEPAAATFTLQRMGIASAKAMQATVETLKAREAPEGEQLREMVAPVLVDLRGLECFGFPARGRDAAGRFTEDAAAFRERFRAFAVETGDAIDGLLGCIWDPFQEVSAFRLSFRSVPREVR